MLDLLSKPEPTGIRGPELLMDLNITLLLEIICIDTITILLFSLKP